MNTLCVINNLLYYAGKKSCKFFSPFKMNVHIYQQQIMLIFYFMDMQRKIQKIEIHTNKYRLISSEMYLLPLFDAP